MMNSKLIFPIMLGLTFISFLFYYKITFASSSKLNIKKWKSIEVKQSIHTINNAPTEINHFATQQNVILQNCRRQCI